VTGCKLGDAYSLGLLGVLTVINDVLNRNLGLKVKVLIRVNGERVIGHKDNIIPLPIEIQDVVLKLYLSVFCGNQVGELHMVQRYFAELGMKRFLYLGIHSL